MSTTLETIKAELEALQVAHDANVAARLNTLIAKDTLQTVTCAERDKVKETKVAESVAETAEAVAAALLASGLERLRASINALAGLGGFTSGQGYPQGPGQPGYSAASGYSGPSGQSGAGYTNQPGQPGYNQGTVGQPGQPGYNPTQPGQSGYPGHPYNPNAPGAPVTFTPGALTPEQLASGNYGPVNG